MLIHNEYCWIYIPYCMGDFWGNACKTIKQHWSIQIPIWRLITMATVEALKLQSIRVSPIINCTVNLCQKILAAILAPTHDVQGSTR